MTVELRTITPDEWALLRDVRLRALADSPDAFGSTLGAVRLLPEADWRARAGGSGGPTLVAVEEGVGLAMGGVFAPRDETTAWVWGMWTDPVARGRGIGGLLLDALLDWVRDPSRAGARYGDVGLHVTEGNTGARALYVSRGFVATGVWEPLREGSDVRIEELRLSV